MLKGVSMLGACGALLLAGAAANADILLQEVMRGSVAAATSTTSPWFMGKGLATIAWNGTDAYVAGQSFDGTGAGIIKVTPAVGTTAVAFQLSGAFGSLPTAATRGYQDLALGPNGKIGAAFDNGAGQANGLQIFNTDGTGGVTATFNTRGNGAHWDPVDGKFTAIVLGSGRVSKLNNDGTTYNDGVKNWDTTTGPIINAAGIGGGSSTYRDMTMDNAGNLYFRAQNAIGKATRTGDGLGYSGLTQLKASLSTNVNGQNIEFISSSTAAFADTLLYTERLTTSLGQSITDVVKGMDVNGVAMPVSFSFLGDFGVPLTSAGAYDISYDAGTQTVAISDFTNNTFYVFRVIPTPGTGALLGLGGLVALRRRR